MSTAQSLQKATAKGSELNSDSRGLLQRKCNSCGQHTIAGGSCSRCETEKGALQKKLMVGAPDDPLEREADRVADQVMRMEAYPDTSTSPPRIQRFIDHPSDIASEAPESVERVLASPGEALEPTLREDMEQRFDQDFSRVRIHSDSVARESARDVGANAYTVANQIVFEQPQPTSSGAWGRRLIAHELAHVVQLSSYPQVRTVRRGPSGKPTPVGPSLEQTFSNFTPDEISLLRKARETEKPQGTSIVGVLIAEDGRQFFISSGGGQGFSSHVEGKATKLMNDMGIKRATLLVELEPCPICDRSTWSGPDVPKEGVPNPKTGKPMALQTAKINSALPKGSSLKIVGPESTGIYWGSAKSYSQGSSNPLPSSASTRPQASTSNSEQATSSTEPKPSPKPSKSTIVKKDITGGAIVAGSLTSEPAASSATSAETASFASNQQAPGASSTYSSPAPDNEQPNPPMVKPGDNPRAATAGTVPQSGGSSPALPGRTTTSAVSGQLGRRNGAASKQPLATTTSPKSTATTGTPTSLPTSAVMNEKPTAIGAALGLANELVKAALVAISEVKAHSAAWNEYYESIHGIMDELWERPGEGAAIEFKFIHIRHPQDIVPGSTEYAGMQKAIGANSNIRVPHNPTMEAGRDFNSANVKSETIRRWIPPVRPAAPTAATLQHDTTKSASPQAASSQATAAQPAPAQKPLILIATYADLVKYVKVRPDLFVRTSLDAYEFLNSGVAIMNGYEIIRFEAIYTVPHAFRMVLLKGFRGDLTQHLSRRANELEADIRFHENRLSSFLQEGWPFTIRRGDIDLRKHEHMFDSPKAHHAAARGMIGTGAFRQALESLERGENHIAQSKKILFHYEKGIPYGGPD